MPRIYSLLGSYYGNQGWEIEQIKALENFQGKKHAVVNLFTNWCDQITAMDNLFTHQLPKIWSNQNIPLITWEPYLCDSASTPPDVVQRAASGEYDS